MITTILFILLLLIVTLVFFNLILNGFKNKERKHLQDPSEFNIDFEEVWIPTKNSKKLYGWWMPEAHEKPTIIVVHGWGRNVGSTIPYLAELYGKGYNLLTFDARNHGHSEKEKHSTLVKFAEDILAAIDFLKTKKVNVDTGIGLIGLSIGGAASIYCAASDSRINAVVTVGSFADTVQIMLTQMKNKHVPGFLAKQILRYMESVVGFRFDDVAPKKHIGKSEAKFLLIHGHLDQTIPFEEMTKLFNNGIKQNVETWELPGRGHSDCHFEDGYWERLLGFFNRKLIPSANVPKKSD